MVELIRPRNSSDQENLAKIREHLSREGVRDVLKRIDQKFKQQPARMRLFCGIAPDGLFVGVLRGWEDDYKAIAADTNLPADQIEQQMVEAILPHMFVDQYRDGGTTIFPGEEMSPVLAELSKMSDGEIKAKYPGDERMLPLVKFYKQTGGFYFPTPEEPGGIPSVGGKTVYPLDLS